MIHGSPGTAPGAPRSHEIRPGFSSKVDFGTPFEAPRGPHGQATNKAQTPERDHSTNMEILKIMKFL